MTCEACTQAEVNPRTGLYRIGCAECSARMLAHSPEFAESAARQTLTQPYKAALAVALVPGERIEQTHQRVRAWDRRIRGLLSPAVAAGLRLDPFCDPEEA